jgi:uncharacterized Tic20 family protein
MTNPPAAAPAAPLSEADDKLWASLAHLGGILGILPSLIIWLVLKDRGPRVNVEGKEALNFQITSTIFLWGSYILGTILLVVFIGVLFYIVAFAVGVVTLIFSIMGFVKVNGGGSYRYPFAFRWIK